MNKKKSLEIAKYSKKLQNKLNLSIKYYKEYSEIYTPIKKKYYQIIKYKVNLLILMKMSNHIIIYILMMVKKK